MDALLERDLGFCQLSGQIAHRTGVWLPFAVSGDGNQVSQGGYALHVDDSLTGERNTLVDVVDRAQEVADFIKVRWLGKTEHRDKWSFCLKAASMRAAQE